MTLATTTVLGVEYPGLPLFNSLAMSLYCYEQQGKTKEAQALLDAHNKIAAAFGQPPVDLAKQFSKFAGNVGSIIPVAREAMEAQDRLIDRIVTKTARAA